MSGPPSQTWETNILVLPAGLWVRLSFYLNPQSLRVIFFLSTAEKKKKRLFSTGSVAGMGFTVTEDNDS